MYLVIIIIFIIVIIFIIIIIISKAYINHQHISVVVKCIRQCLIASELKVHHAREN